MIECLIAYGCYPTRDGQGGDVIVVSERVIADCDDGEASQGGGYGDVSSSAKVAGDGGVAIGHGVGVLRDVVAHEEPAGVTFWKVFSGRGEVGKGVGMAPDG